jgi:hypothetical protein
MSAKKTDLGWTAFKLCFQCQLAPLQLGVLATRSVPPLMSAVLPAAAGAACRAYMQAGAYTRPLFSLT